MSLHGGRGGYDTKDGKKHTSKLQARAHREATEPADLDASKLTPDVSHANELDSTIECDLTLDLGREVCERSGLSGRGRLNDLVDDLLLCDGGMPGAAVTTQDLHTDSLSTEPGINAEGTDNPDLPVQAPLNLIDLAAERKRRAHKQPDTEADSTALTERPIAAITPAPSEADSAQVLEFSQRSVFYASIEIDDFLSLKMLYSDVDLQLLLDSVGCLLAQQFGQENVQRQHRNFLVLQADFELLVAGLLRAQFFACKIDMPSQNIFGESSRQSGLTLTWGAGRCKQEAQLERLKKQRYKQQRRRNRKAGRKPVQPR